MTALEVQVHAMSDAANQLQKVVADLPDDQWTARVNEQAMSPLESFAHLAACCNMYSAEAQGIKKEWGEYQVEDMTPAGVMKAWHDERAQAQALLEADPSDENLKRVTMYITLHDAYHVGQLCTLRLTLDPEWNAYAIYE
jgi:uncharacterized damage-inducible protein DinB